MATQRERSEERITELANLTEGWLDGYGAAPIDTQSVQSAREFAAALPEGMHEFFGIYPTEQGGIQFESAFHEHRTPSYYEVEITPDGKFTVRKIILLIEDLSEESDYEGTFDDADSACTQLKELLGDKLLNIPVY